MIAFVRTTGQLGHAVREARKKRGWSQTEVAQRAGLRQGTISDIERGQSAARLDSIFSVLAALELDIEITSRRRDELSANSLKSSFVNKIMGNE